MWFSRSASAAALLAALPAAQAILGTTIFNNDWSTYVVAIIDPMDQNQLLCSGSIISDRHILTAASCFMSVRDGYSSSHSRNAKVVAGHQQAALNSMTIDPTQVKNPPEAPMKPQYMDIANVDIHPSFNPVNWRDHPGLVIDLAIITLDTHLKLGAEHKADFVVLGSNSPTFLKFLETAQVSPQANTINNYVLGYGTATQILTQKGLVLMPDVTEADGVTKRKSCEPDVTRFLPGQESDFDPMRYFCIARESAPPTNNFCPEVGDLGAPAVIETPFVEQFAKAGVVGRRHFQLGLYAGDGAFFRLPSSAFTKDLLQSGAQIYATKVAKCDARNTLSDGTGRPNFQRFLDVTKFGAWIQKQTGTILPEMYPSIPLKTITALIDAEVGAPKGVGSPFNTMLKLQTIFDNVLAGPNGFQCTAADCGSIGKHNKCWCDLDCRKMGDCCSNFLTLCYTAGNLLPSSPLSCMIDQATKQTACGAKTSGSGKTTVVASARKYGCWCDVECTKNNDCCFDFPSVCGLASAMSGAKGSCIGNCGKRVNNCWCDSTCAANGDCCPDASICQGTGAGLSNGSCQNNCGHNAGLCWCDPGCREHGDCCPDFDFQCRQLRSEGSCKNNCGLDTVSRDGTKCWCDVRCVANNDCCPDFQGYCHAE